MPERHSSCRGPHRSRCACLHSWRASRAYVAARLLCQRLQRGKAVHLRYSRMHAGMKGCTARDHPPFHVQVVVLMSGEVSLFATQPTKHGRLQVLDSTRQDIVSAGPLLGLPEVCTAVAKTNASILCVGAFAFKRFLKRDVRFVILASPSTAPAHVQICRTELPFSDKHETSSDSCSQITFKCRCFAMQVAQGLKDELQRQRERLEQRVALLVAADDHITRHPTPEGADMGAACQSDRERITPLSSQLGVVRCRFLRP
jgi:hypothetical protein